MSNESSSNVVVEKRIRDLLASIAVQADPAIAEQVIGLLDVGEFRVAVENLCELLCEDRVLLSPFLYKELLDLVKVLGVDQRYCAMLPVPPEPSE